MENLREFFRQGALPWPYTGYKFVKSRAGAKCYECKLPINPGELYFGTVNGKLCTKHMDVEKIQSYRERLRMAKSIIVLGTDASGPGGERWAFVVYRSSKEKREEIYRCRGFTGGLAGPTPAEGIAIIKALEWAIQATQEGIISADEFLQVDTDNYAVHAKLIEKGRVWGRYSDIWVQLGKLCDSLGERLIVAYDPEAIREADRYAASS
jgi:hypothetical protein